MRIIKVLVLSYITVLAVLLHATLFYCTQPHCLVSLQKPPLSITMGYHLRQAISKLLPFEIMLLQNIAQWLVAG